MSERLMRDGIQRYGKHGWYRFAVDLGRDPVTGRRLRKWYSGYRTRKEAVAARTEILSTLQAGTYVLPSKETLAEFLNEWLRAIKTRVRESTWESYERNVKSHIIPRLGSVQLQALTPATLNAFYADLLTEGRLNGKGKERKPGISPSTVRYIHTILRKALKDAVRWNRLVRNVADSADPPSQRQTKARKLNTWSPEEARKFLASRQADRLYALWRLAVLTGMRRGEIAGLRWEDVDLDACTLAVRRTLVTAGYRVIRSDPKTERGRRSIDLDRATVDTLRAHRKRQIEERLAFGSAYTDSGYVFTREDGEPLHPERLSVLFERHRKAAGLPEIRFHDLRHTHATLLLQAGESPKVVSERLGHASVAFTLDRYSHVVPGMQKDAAGKLATLIDG